MTGFEAFVDFAKSDDRTLNQKKKIRQDKKETNKSKGWMVLCKAAAILTAEIKNRLHKTQRK